MLTLDQLVVGYNGVPILPPISSSVLAGQTLFVMGPNGSGKSTFIKTTLGLLPPISGAFRWATDARRTYVQQAHGTDLTIRRRVVDFVSGGADTGLSFLKPGFLRSTKVVVDKAMADCDVTSIAQQQLSELSEGQRQRVYLARAIASEPSVLVLDEPTSAMDSVNERAILKLLVALQAERNLTLVLVSHRMQEVGALAHTALLIDRGRDIAATGPIEDIWNSAPFQAIYGKRPIPNGTNGPDAIAPSPQHLAAEVPRGT